MKGKELEGRARDITQRGDAVIETDQGIVMARGALPGELVRVALTGRAQGTLHGKIRAVLEPHPERASPACDLTEACGGCPLMALGLDAQRAWKRGLIERALSVGGERPGSLAPVEVVASPASYGYRTRARLAFCRTGRGLVLGYRAASSRDVVDVPRCAVLAPELDRAAARAREHLAPVLQGRGELRLALGVGGKPVLQLACDDLQPPEVYRALELLAAQPELAGVSLTVADGAPVSHGDIRQLAPGADEQPVWGAPFGFAQANDALNRELVAHVLDLADACGLSVLELYAGHGNFTVGLARDAREVVAVESDRAAAEACRLNVKARALENVRVRVQDAAIVAGERGACDVVVLDPPRAGAKDALAGIARLKPKRIVYVSCELGTLRRDLGLLAGFGYEPAHARGFDMFPHTPHVETVVKLERAR